MDTYVLLSIAVCFLTILLIRWFNITLKLPPGPIGLPIIGHVLYLSHRPYLDFNRLAKKYGEIFRIQLGSCNVIILNDYATTKEAFAKDAFMGRPRDFIMEFNQETLDTEAIIGLPWKEHRRFSLHMLRDLGLGKSKMEVFVQEEILELLDHIKKNVDKPYKINEMLTSSMSNIISSLIFGKRLRYDDPARHMTNRTLRELTAAVSQTALYQFFPWLKKTMQFFGVGSTCKIERILQDLKNYVTMEIEEHEKTFDPSNIRDYIDGYLYEIKKRNDPSFSKPVITDITLLFFGAGSETVKTTVEWLLLIAAAHQDYQKRIHLEIDEVVERDQLISRANHTSMPFTEAFITEMMRWKSVLPLNLIRYTLADGELGGYFIPKNSHIISNLWAIHHDPDYWGSDAHEFRPNRFLTDDGKSVKKWEHLSPFSVGKRACPGEPLAKVEVFVYFTSILQNFHVKLPEGSVANFEGNFGATLMPVSQDLIYTIRS